MRYLRLFLNCVLFSIKKSMVFRLDFFFRIIMDVLFFVQAMLFYYFLFQTTDSIGGWNKDQALIFVAGFCVVDALQMTFFSNNVWWLPVAINKGELDYYLVRPVNSLFFLSFREFATNSFVNFLISMGLLYWAIDRYPVPISAWQVVLYVALLFNGAFLHYILHTLTVLPVFWIQSSRGFEDIYWSLNRAMERPDRIFKGWTWRLFTMFLPFSLMASVPARLVLEEFKIEYLFLVLGVTAVFWGLLVFVWNRGLRVYGSASS